MRYENSYNFYHVITIIEFNLITISKFCKQNALECKCCLDKQLQTLDIR